MEATQKSVEQEMRDRIAELEARESGILEKIESTANSEADLVQRHEARQKIDVNALAGLQQQRENLLKDLRVARATLHDAQADLCSYEARQHELATEPHAERKQAIKGELERLEQELREVETLEANELAAATRLQLKATELRFEASQYRGG